MSQDHLKGGGQVEIGYVDGPDLEWAGRLIPFLNHKEPWFLFHITKALAQPLDDLRTRFYVATVRGEIIANVMVVSAHGVGILGHVYTAPEWRRKGAMLILMRALMPDLAQELDIVTLGARYDSVAYRIYRDFGFRSVPAGSGDMRWLARPDEAGHIPDQGDCSVEPLRWDDWPLYSWATLHEFAAEPAPRSPAAGIVRRGSSEAGLARVMQSAAAGGSSHLILHGARRTVLGWCHVVPEHGLLRGMHLLDLHTMAGFESYLPDLVGRVTWPTGPVAFSMTPSFGVYADALSGAGFVVDRRLSGVLAATGATPGEVWLRDG